MFMQEDFFMDTLKVLRARPALFFRLSGIRRVIAESGVLVSESSGDQIALRHLNTIFELYPSYHLGQVVEAAQTSPLLFRTLTKLEHHVQHAVTRQASF